MSLGQIVAMVVIAIVLIAACVFVNDTKKKHGTCCGKGCAGCPVFEEERQQQKARDKAFLEQKAAEKAAETQSKRI